ncbi:1,2-phenylacetyl-CoA epoxidase subunit PaaE [Aliikangiella sp. G2MR2-5]|uniref:1,2-phenylacetyl-CoA epoxidase subunit PaaE n=1 Tax=Aliikangiella sp. G2MR2-5 TaxID=2788943 RepID=UPI0018AB4F27|nr:1,2-phenylacetyl-CoA epoxidase subunit PaaE [Aliikangiella sp. G2MR2-5]
MSTEFHPLKISKLERLTKDAVSISFELPKELADEYQYRQGQHLTLKADIDGHDVRRSYSICNSANEQKLTVGIKRIDAGLFSNYANDKLEAGMTLEVMPPQGHFYTELSETNSNHYLMVAAGSGITPMLSHIQTILENEPKAMVTLIYGNKSTPLMMFREKLSFIKNRFIDRLHWINLFTQEENEAEVFNGRISAQKLLDLNKARVIDLASFDEVFLCGPESMINDVAAFFEVNKMPKEKIHYELFFAGSAEDKASEKIAQRAEKYGEKTAKVSVKVAGRKTTLELAMGGDNILDAAMEAGADLPFSCKGGVCATCKAKVVKGKVEMDLNHSLTPEEVAEGMVLTCQSHPVSDEVEIDFDLNN